MQKVNATKRHILPISFTILLFIIMNRFHGTSYEPFQQLSTHSEITATQYYKGVPEEVSYSLSPDAVLQLNSH